ncbi:right-handed parallel beta-helix repeat-containing protein [bacterium]|nr:right-handed parallel beta-helix repeat-containing protein [bacterium]
MKRRLRLNISLITVLAVLLALSCTLAGVAKGDKNHFEVKNVDQFLAALGSGHTVVLAKGEYNLTKAKDYGKNDESKCYAWNNVGDGYELHIKNVRDLAIVGAGREKTAVVCEPRYANVFSFTGCSDIEVSNLTAGHTKEQGYCSGGVLSFSNSKDIDIEDCCLYGCGTYGIIAADSHDLSAENCIIKECSYGALDIRNCSDVSFSKSLVFDCGLKAAFNCFDLLSIINSSDFDMYEVEVKNNKTDTLFNLQGSLDAEIYSCKVSGNTVNYSVFKLRGTRAVLDGCSFSCNTVSKGWYSARSSEDGGQAEYMVNRENKKLEESDFLQMKYVPYRD